MNIKNSIKKNFDEKIRSRDLHRTPSVPEWETIPRKDWNEIHYRAHETKGWDTPGNRETLKGAILTLGGLALLSIDTVWTSGAGVIAIGLGRYKDIKDGKVAAATRTKSPLGEKVDAITDNVLMVAALGTLWSNGIIPTKESIALASIVAIKTAATSSAKIRNRELHPSNLAKFGAVGAWAGIGIHTAARTLSYENPHIAHTINTVGSTVNWAGIAIGTIASAGYIIQAVMPNNTFGETSFENTTE